MSENATSEENLRVLAKAKSWFKEKIITSHLRRTEKLSNSSEFDINPFTTPYLSAFYSGDITAEGIAKALVYPRVLGTSIATSFGQNLQSFISDVLVDAYGSLVQGIDIKFVDKLDGREKYAQLKLGPNTINADDVATIHNHFNAIRSLARTNSVKLQANDLIVCIMYGEEEDISGHYKCLRDQHHYPVIVGNEFWHRLTGDPLFFGKLVNSISATLNEVNSSDLIKDVVEKLASSTEIQNLAKLARKESNYSMQL